MSPFESPNYTQTPNDLFDQLLPEMGLAELKVVLCIVRHTFGYHRDEVKLSIRAIARFTGLNVNSVMEGAKQAEAHGLIERYMDGNKTTMWRAVVSVLATQTRRLSYSDASVLASKTLLGLKKERKTIKQIEDEREAPKTNLYSVYENEIGAITPFIADAIDAWVKDGFPAKWIADAIHEAAAQNKRSWKYCEAIIKRWDAQGNQNPIERGNGNNKTKPASTGSNLSVADAWLLKKEQEANNGRS